MCACPACQYTNFFFFFYFDSPSSLGKMSNLRFIFGIYSFWQKGNKPNDSTRRYLSKSTARFIRPANAAWYHIGRVGRFSATTTSLYNTLPNLCIAPYLYIYRTQAEANVVVVRMVWRLCMRSPYHFNSFNEVRNDATLKNNKLNFSSRIFMCAVHSVHSVQSAYCTLYTNTRSAYSFTLKSYFVCRCMWCLFCVSLSACYCSFYIIIISSRSGT